MLVSVLGITRMSAAGAFSKLWWAPMVMPSRDERLPLRALLGVVI
jgi:hypothetical protein